MLVPARDGLDDADYHRALEAHRNRWRVRAEGELELVGRRMQLVRARFEVLDRR